MHRSQLAPTAADARVDTLDVLRGFALFGVLWANLGWFGTADPATASDHAFSWMLEWMVDSRLYTMLGFLFGVGFAIQLQRAGDSEAGGVFRRRMVALLAFGLTHGLLIWSGDILTCYALLGFLMVPYSRLPQRRLLVAAALTYFLLPYAMGRIYFLINGGPLLAGGNLHGAAGTAIFADGSYSQVVAYRVQDFLWKLKNFFVAGGFGRFLCLFLLGMWAVRAGLLSKLVDKRWLWKALAVALVVMAAGIYWQANLNSWWPRPPSNRFSWAPYNAVAVFGINLQEWGNAAGYMFALALLALTTAGRRLLAPLIAVGRMPLTTYLMQSLVTTTLFYGYGFGLWGHLPPTATFVTAAIVFSLQMAASTWWLKRYQFGPAEWLWRSFAYSRPQPMRIRQTSGTAAA
jgi:uncharacterized protein